MGGSYEGHVALFQRAIGRHAVLINGDGLDMVGSEAEDVADIGVAWLLNGHACVARDQQACQNVERILRAQGEQESIRLVLSAMGDTEENKQTVIGYLLGQSYIKVLPNMAKEGERVFVPYESSALLGSMGMFRELAGSPEDIVRQSVKQDGLRGGMVASAGSS